MIRLEVGRYYKTRSGELARIYAIDGASPNCVHGAVLTRDGWAADSWNRDGLYLAHLDDRRESGNDLVELAPPSEQLR